MTTLTSVYKGSLRTENTHTRSGQVVITDAPVDNKGKGEAFSPTDLVCTALSSCMLTTMAIVADREQVDMTGMTTEVVKIIGSNPRKIAEIQVTLTHSGLKASAEQIDKLKHAAHTCPVALSLHESVKQTITFKF
ncbi:MAG: OsmC family peroxiredoxin [Cyclobacteriaceae bacterium]|nr:MAG: OsmC family peroxiredoxin [Cyclobacteriaceae bacterium]